MSTSHRKAVEDDATIPAAPWPYLVTGAILVILVAALVFSIMAIGAPAAKASTDYLRPAVSAAKAWPVPARCKTPTGTLPSGDAGIFRGQTYVCTDGTWVHVDHYGN